MKIIIFFISFRHPMGLSLRLPNCLAFLFYALAVTPWIWSACIDRPIYEQQRQIQKTSELDIPSHCIRLEGLDCEDVFRKVKGWLSVSVDLPCEQVAIKAVHQWLIKENLIDRQLEWYRKHVGAGRKQFLGPAAKRRRSEIVQAVITPFSWESFFYIYPRVFRQTASRRNNKPVVPEDPEFAEFQTSLGRRFVKKLSLFEDLASLLEELNRFEIGFSCTFISKIKLPAEFPRRGIRISSLISILKRYRPGSDYSDEYSRRDVDRLAPPSIYKRCGQSPGDLISGRELGEWIIAHLNDLTENWLKYRFEELVGLKTPLWGKLHEHIRLAETFKRPLASDMLERITDRLSQLLSGSEEWTAKSFSDLFHSFGQDQDISKLMRSYITTLKIPKNFQELVRGGALQWKSEVCSGAHQSCSDLFLSLNTSATEIIRKKNCDSLVSALVSQWVDARSLAQHQRMLKALAKPIITDKCNPKYVKQAGKILQPGSDALFVYKKWRKEAKDRNFTKNFDNKLISSMTKLFKADWKVFLKKGYFEGCVNAFNASSCNGRFEKQILELGRVDLQRSQSDLSEQNYHRLQETQAVLQKFNRQAWRKLLEKIGYALRWMKLNLDTKSSSDLKKLRSFHAYRLGHGHEGYIKQLQTRIDDLSQRIGRQSNFDLKKVYVGFLEGKFGLPKLEDALQVYLQVAFKRSVGVVPLAQAVWELKQGKGLTLRLKVSQVLSNDPQEKLTLVPYAGEESFYELRSTLDLDQRQNLQIILKSGVNLTFVAYLTNGRKLGQWSLSYEDLITSPWRRGKRTDSKRMTSSVQGIWNLEWTVPEFSDLGFPDPAQLDY
jgi:hypothetical protein